MMPGSDLYALMAIHGWPMPSDIQAAMIQDRPDAIPVLVTKTDSCILVGCADCNDLGILGG